MKFAVIGGTGLIGSQVVKNLIAAVPSAVPALSVDGRGHSHGPRLEAAVAGADVVINLTNSQTFDAASAAFFRTSMDNLLAASQKAGVKHFVILSILGAEQVDDPTTGRRCSRKTSGRLIPYSIVRATQFMEFMDGVLSWTASGNTVRLPRTPIQPIAAADVARSVAEVAAGAPLNGVLNVAGPDVYPRRSRPAHPVVRHRPTSKVGRDG